MTALADRLLCHAQALENQAMHYAEQGKTMLSQSRRATANLLREAAAELKK